LRAAQAVADGLARAVELVDFAQLLQTQAAVGLWKMPLHLLLQ
jgi:hypothetical protein